MRRLRAIVGATQWRFKSSAVVALDIAQMAELVDAQASGVCIRKDVGVRLSLWAPVLVSRPETAAALAAVFHYAWSARGLCQAAEQLLIIWICRFQCQQSFCEIDRLVHVSLVAIDRRQRDQSLLILGMATVGFDQDFEG